MWFLPFSQPRPSRPDNRKAEAMPERKKVGVTVFAAGFAEPPTKISVTCCCVTQKGADRLVESLRMNFPHLVFTVAEWSSDTERMNTIPGEVVMPRRAFEGEFSEEHQEVAEVADRIVQFMGCRGFGTPTRKKQTDRGKGQPRGINARMRETIQENFDATGWSCTEWAKHLSCAKSSVVETPAWKDLAMARLRLKAERATDRRRGPKGSDQRKAKRQD